MRRISKEDWQLADIQSMESAGWEAIKSESSVLVIAGPGAGKTELLAQRACFLLQTEVCSNPYRILAISFKKDAAKNLRDRVRRRCGRESRRFDSMTFDAFAKSLIDRFWRAIPPSLGVTSGYEIRFDITRAATLRERLVRIASSNPQLVNEIMNANAQSDFYQKYVIGNRLPKDASNLVDQSELLGWNFWQDALKHGSESQVNFQMLGRLAELLLRTNPKILSALRKTYKFVFLDEFQDTTDIQYSLVTTAFKGTDAVLTAVGDPKQQIMRWAGAIDGIFQDFSSDFAARPLSLSLNYRSAPRLIEIQRVLVASMDSHATLPEVSMLRKDERGECNLYVFDNVQSEATHIASVVSDTIKSRSLSPRDVCLLTRTWNDTYSQLIAKELLKLGINSRTEKVMQDLLAEPLVQMFLASLKIAIRTRHPQSWSILIDAISEMRSLDSSNKKAKRIEKQTGDFIRQLSAQLSQGANKETLAQATAAIVDFLGKSQLKRQFPQYAQGSFFDTLIEIFITEMGRRLTEHGDWSKAVNDFEGLDSVPIMTVHKSKGLEYELVVFLGLEDSALWGFANAPAEETCGFFVAFSRAINRVIFTFCKTRPKRAGGFAQPQSIKQIKQLYETLGKAGVKPEFIPTK